jgi:hypothetical protein
MSEEREKALRMALKALLIASRKLGLNLDELSGTAADELLQYREYDALHVPMAINEIEVAVDALV